MYILWYALAAFAGGVLSAILGWGDSGEPFHGRTFMMSVIRSLISGALAATASNIIAPTATAQAIGMIFLALTSGAGVDVLLKNTPGVYRAIGGKSSTAQPNSTGGGST
jgi:hypothetical protein